MPKTLILLMAIMLGYTISARAETFTAVSDPWPPFVDSSPTQGLLTQIAREALATEGHKLIVELVPWSRAVEMVKHRQRDFLIGIWYTAERDQYLLYSEPLYFNELVFASNNKQTFEYQNLSSLEGKTIGIIPSYTYSPEFLNADYFERIKAKDLPVNLRNVANGRLDLTIDDKSVIRYLLDKKLPDIAPDIRIGDKPLISKGLHIAASRRNKEHAKIIALINAGLKKLKASGRYQEIIDDHHN